MNLEGVSCPCPPVPLWTIPNDKAGCPSAGSLCQVTGWVGLSQPIPLLGADNRMSKTKSSVRVTVPTLTEQRLLQAHRSEGVQTVRHASVDPEERGSCGVGSTRAPVCTLTCVHITGSGTHEITDRSHPHPVSPAPQGVAWECEGAPGGSRAVCLDHQRGALDRPGSGFPTPIMQGLCWQAATSHTASLVASAKGV